MSLTKNQVHQGDCLQLFKKVPSETVDLIFADPPFNIGYDYDVYDDSRRTEEYLEWCQGWIREVHRTLKPDGTFWLAIGDEYAAELKIAAQQAGFLCRTWVIWYYTFGVNCRNGFSRSHTHLFHFIKDPKRFTFNRMSPQIRIPSARQLVYADLRANPNGRLPDNTWIIRPQDAPASFQPMHDTWYFARVAGTFKEREGFHGCQMPEQLLGRIIRASSHPLELVLDPFSGSGTTLCVAKKLGRQWMGFELSKDYARYITERLSRTEVGEELDGPADPIRSSPTTQQGKRRPKTTHAELEHQIVSVYEQTAQGHSADHWLCDPEVNAAFRKECESKGLDGNPVYWNQMVLRLRKAGRLPKTTRDAPRLAFRDMDEFSYGSEIAWRLVSVEYAMTLEQILCTPEFAEDFDRLAEALAPGFTPFQYRWAALALRKRANKARRLAAADWGPWIDGKQKLPAPIDFSRSQTARYDQSGVYLVRSGEQVLYVGETDRLSRRALHIQQIPKWQEMSPDSLIMIPAQSTKRIGLQSALIQRLDPVLNVQLLRDPSATP